MAITWSSIPWRRRVARHRPRRLAGTLHNALCLAAAAAASAVLLLLAAYVADGYIVNWASVTVVVLLCAVAAWGMVEVVHGAGARRVARRRDEG